MLSNMLVHTANHGEVLLWDHSKYDWKVQGKNVLFGSENVANVTKVEDCGLSS